MTWRDSAENAFDRMIDKERKKKARAEKQKIAEKEPENTACPELTGLNKKRRGRDFT